MAAWLAPVIAAGASLVGSVINKSSQSSANKQNLELAQYQNNWNLQQWNRENAYNSPIQQMARLRQAGLNPNLVYGNGTTTQSASSPRAADMRVAPYLGASQDLTSAANVALNAQNVVRQNELAKAQADYVRQQTITEGQRQSQIALSNSRSEVDLSIARELEKYSIEAGKENLRKLRSEANISESTQFMKEYEQKFLQPLQKDLNEAQLRQLETATANLRQDMDFNRFEQDLKRMGIYPQDKLYIRILSRVMKFLFPKLNFGF